MRRPPLQRGFTLLEVMLALAILMIGAVGVARFFQLGQQMNGDARHLTRAIALAEDLAEKMKLASWDPTATWLQNSQPGNDADIADTQFQFTNTTDPVGAGIADHDEADIPASWGTVQTGLNSDQYQRFWNVAVSGSLVQIAVIVRWPVRDTGWRRVVLLTAKLNPAGNR